MKKDVVVVIPVYRPFTPSEEVSFRRCVDVLGGYDISVIQPESLAISYDAGKAVNFSVNRIGDKWFKSVGTYNFLMLSSDFYNMYSEYEYMLIYQLDAYVFHDSLGEWVAKGYDYVGAPWIPNTNLFQSTIGELVRIVRKTLRPAGTTGRVTHAQMHYSVGNGGFSLRRVAKMQEITSRFSDDIKHLRFGEKKAQEDVFLSVFLRKKAGLRVPGWREALGFAVENNPERCLRLNGGKLPFGCHGWSRGCAWKDFWHKYIPFEPAV